MLEIENIVLQLSDIVSAQQIPILCGGSMDDYLCCIASGMIQFVCARVGKDNFRTLTADHISIHPGSNMFKTDPMYIVAGEIVRTSRMFAMSVSPLTKFQLEKIDSNLEKQLNLLRKEKSKNLIPSYQYYSNVTFKVEYEKQLSSKDKKSKKDSKKNTDTLTLGNFNFQIKKIKSKQFVLLPLNELIICTKENNFFKDNSSINNQELHLKISSLKAKVLLKNGFELLSGEKLELVLRIASMLNLVPIDEKKFNRKLNVNINEPNGITIICNAMENLLNVTVAKSKSKEMGFICAFTDNNSNYWFKTSRGFATALSESLSTLETLIDECADKFSDEQKERINHIYRKLNSFYEN